MANEFTGRPHVSTKRNPVQWATTHDMDFIDHRPGVQEDRHGRHGSGDLAAVHPLLNLSPADVRRTLLGAAQQSNVFFTKPVTEGYCQAEGNGLAMADKCAHTPHINFRWLALAAKMLIGFARAAMQV